MRILNLNKLTILNAVSQEAQPGRIRHMVFINEGKFLDTMLAIFMFYMKDKMKERVSHVKINGKYYLILEISFIALIIYPT